MPLFEFKVGPNDKPISPKYKNHPNAHISATEWDFLDKNHRGLHTMDSICAKLERNPMKAD